MRSWRRSNRETSPSEQPTEQGREGPLDERSATNARSRRERAGGERRRLGSRAHGAAGATAGAIGAGVLTLARLVMTLATLIAVLIALAIVLRDVDATASNSIVKGIHEGANFFAGSFTGLIRFSGHPKRAITVDWGIALLVYLLVGAFVSRLIASVGRGGMRFGQRHTAAASH